jgi:hypothetical protein
MQWRRKKVEDEDEKRTKEEIHEVGSKELRGRMRWHEEIDEMGGCTTNIN